MATRQYIGARYVPTFADPIEWNKERSYEALTIVTYLSNSYTSKKPVPIGVDITNKEYWVVTGNYNSQVELYRQSVEQLNDKVNNEVEKLNTKINDETTNRKNDVEQNGWSFSGNGIKNKHIIFMGDSYAEGAICIGTNPNTYTREYSDGWMSKTIHYLGMDSEHAIPIYKGGASFSLTGGNHWQDALNNYPLENGNDIDAIVVLGGANDAPETTERILAGINEFFNVARKKCPNATVIIGMVGFSWWGTSINKFYKVFTAYKDGAITNGGIYVSNIENILHHTAYFSPDGLHATAEGYTVIAKELTNFLRCGSIDYVVEGQYSFTPSIENSAIQTFTESYTYTHNNISGIKTQALVLRFDTKIASFKLDGSETNLGVLNNVDVIGRDEKFGAVSRCKGVLHSASGFLATEASIRISGRTLFVKFYVLNSAGTGWVTLENVDSLQLYDIDITTDNLIPM